MTFKSDFESHFLKHIMLSNLLFYPGMMCMINRNYIQIQLKNLCNALAVEEDEKEANS